MRQWVLMKRIEFKYTTASLPPRFWSMLSTFEFKAKYSTVHKLIYEENGPPVMIKLSTLTVLPQNETTTIRCEVAGAQYFLWNFPNGDFLQTPVPTVSQKPYRTSTPRPRN